ncbi:hypothetical protein BC941DRAFT_408552 [Chlamydoabsidia padenii]|nr:hypothetical protein BC941DRAFT_408552 [Chlamydoabsidia padenii]
MAPTQRPLYIRVKREKSICFLCIKPNDTILNIKNQLIPLMAKTKPVDDLRLYINTAPLDAPPTGRLLEDHQTAKNAGLDNDELVYLVYFDHTLGKWEDITVAEYESLDDEVDDTMDLADETSKKKEKGKGRA